MRRFLVLVAALLLAAPALAAYDPAALNVPPGLIGANGGYPLANYVDPTWPKYGAKGDDSTDDTAALTAALADAVSNNLDVFLAGRTYKTSSTLTVDVCHTRLTSGRLDMTAITSGTALSITTTCADPNQMNVIHARHALENVILDCADGLTSTVTCVALTPTTVAGTPWIHNVVLSHGGIVGGNKALYLSGGGFDLDLDDFSITSITGRGWLYGVYVDAGANSGERNVIRNSQIVNGETSGCGVTNNQAGDLYFYNGSLDGTACLLDAKAGGAVIISSGSHFDVNIHAADTNFAWKTEAQDASIFISNFYLSVEGVRVNQLGNSSISATSPNQGGIFLGDGYINFGGNAYNFDYLITGPGRCSLHNVTFETSQPKIVGCIYSSFLSDPTFSASTGDWTASGGGTFTRQTGGGGPNGSTTYASLTNTTSLGVTITSNKFNCFGGQIPQFSLWIKTSGLSSSGSTLNYAVEYYDLSGRNLSASGGNPISSDLAAWTLTRIPAQTPVVPGAMQCNVVISLGNAASGSATVNVGNINFEAQ